MLSETELVYSHVLDFFLVFISGVSMYASQGGYIYRHSFFETYRPRTDTVYTGRIF